MSLLNNRDTLAHYLGKVWLTKPHATVGDVRQGINVCVETDAGFTAVDHLQLAPDGVYHKRDKPIGRLEDDAFRRYIERLAGAEGLSDEALFRQVRESFEALGDAGQVARALGISTTRVRRILITLGLYTSALIEQIAWLYDDGKGRTVADIADLLHISEDMVKKNMAYGK